MKKTLAIIVSAILAVQAHAQEEFHPLADASAQVVSGNARFTVLTDRLIRMEWSADGRFEDNATLGIVNRDLPVPSFKARKSGKTVTITTGAVKLVYKGPAKFSSGNLSVSFALNGKTVVWKPGMSGDGNLLGTARTLDKFAGDATIDAYDPGVVSRDGWALIDESERHLLVPVDNDWKYWVRERDGADRCDLYMFAYGHDYKAAVSDFTKIAGRVPLPPRYAFGYWWCRYWQYSDFELTDLADHFDSYDIPVDVMIIDMDWHNTWSLGGIGQSRKDISPRDEFGQKIGWTGYTWRHELFPNPDNFLADLHDRGIRTSLNLHPASGIQPYEECYDAFVKDYLSRTSDYDGPKDFVYDRPYKFAGNEDACGEVGEKAPVPFRIDQVAWADAYFNSVIRPIEKQGIDFWWLDWQQWKLSKYMPGLSNTFWLNYTFFNDQARQSASDGKDARRPMIYHRWGGIGSHRYQVGFSGDTYATWKVLGALPYFTFTASNVCYGYWGHDIGGHMQPKGVHHTDPELYTRWLQSGVFTPIFKTHSTKDRSMEKRFWVFPDHFDAMRAAIRLRYDLAPYIYNAAREAYDTGISICRPLYYYYPEEENAYTCREEFFFGPDILATTVCSPVDGNGLAERKMWFPEGDDWFDVSTGTLHKGGTEATLYYTISENPYFVRSGAIIPMSGPKIRNLADASTELRLYVAPGLGTSSVNVYEDDGGSQAYHEDFATTAVCKTADGNGVKLVVEPRKGGFKGAPDTRLIRLVLEGVCAPSKVTVNGVEVPYSRHAERDAAAGKQVWGYTGKDLRMTVYCAESSVSGTTEIFAGCKFDFVNGQKGRLHRMQDITAEYKTEFAIAVNPGRQLPPVFMGISQCASRIQEDPFSAAGYLEGLDCDRLSAEFAEFPAFPAAFVDKVLTQLR